MAMSPLAIQRVSDRLDMDFGRTALQSATAAQLDSAEALLGMWIARIQEERDNRRMDNIGQNGPTGEHYGETA